MGNRIAKNAQGSLKKISFNDSHLIGQLCGEHNTHLQIIEKKIGVSINVRGNEIHLQGGYWEIEVAEKTLTQLYDLLKQEFPIFGNDVVFAVRVLSRDQSADLKKIFTDKVFIASNKLSKDLKLAYINSP